MLKRWLAIIAAAVLLVPASASAASNEMFRGKTITYIVATTAGGGYDTYGRMIARYMPKYLPGSRIIVRNVPGAGNIIGANAIYTARPDGTDHRHVQHRPDLQSADRQRRHEFRHREVQLARQGRDRSARGRALDQVRHQELRRDAEGDGREVRHLRRRHGVVFRHPHSRRRAEAQHPGGQQFHRQHRRAQHAQGRSRGPDRHRGIARAVREDRRRLLRARDFRQRGHAAGRAARRAIRQGRARAKARGARPGDVRARPLASRAAGRARRNARRPAHRDGAGRQGSGLRRRIPRSSTCRSISFPATSSRKR